MEESTISPLPTSRVEVQELLAPQEKLNKEHAKRLQNNHLNIQLQYIGLKIHSYNKKGIPLFIVVAEKKSKLFLGAILLQTESYHMHSN
jgi:hypothetical protein